MNLTYGDSIRKAFDNKFKEGNVYTKIEIIKMGW